MKADGFRRYSVDPPLGFGDPAEDGKAALLHEFPEGAFLQQGNDLGMVSAMGMIMIVVMVMPVFLLMRMGMSMVVTVMMMVTGIRSLVPVMTLDQKAPSGDPSAVGPLEAAGRKRDRQGGKGFEEHFLRNPEVAQGGHGHVAADAGEGVDVEGLHGKGWQGGAAIIPWTGR